MNVAGIGFWIWLAEVLRALVSLAGRCCVGFRRNARLVRELPGRGFVAVGVGLVGVDLVGDLP